jgi:hypothetical protein
MYGSEWKEVMQAQEERLRAMQAEELAKNEMMVRNERERGERKKICLGAVDAAVDMRDESF